MILVRVEVDPEHVPGTVGCEAGHTLSVPSEGTHTITHSLTLRGKCSVANPPTCMFYGESRM